MSLSDIKKNMPEMKRKELIAYDKWLTRRKWGTGEIISPEKAADLYLAEHPLPPAEGAEEILKPFCERDDAEDFLQTKDIWNHPRISDRTDKESYEVAHLMAEFAQEFATLHAQKIADKMVGERLRGKFLLAYDELRDLCCRFFRHWWNSPGANTEEGFDTWAEMNNLKSRDSHG
jgi:hypothetical protein